MMVIGMQKNFSRLVFQNHFMLTKCFGYKSLIHKINFASFVYKPTTFQNSLKFFTLDKFQYSTNKIFNHDSKYYYFDRLNNNHSVIKLKNKVRNNSIILGLLGLTTATTILGVTWSQSYRDKFKLIVAGIFRSTVTLCVWYELSLYARL